MSSSKLNSCFGVGGSGGFLVGFGMRLVGFCGRVIGCETSSLNGSSSLRRFSWLRAILDFLSFISNLRSLALLSFFRTFMSMLSITIYIHLCNIFL